MTLYMHTCMYKYTSFVAAAVTGAEQLESQGLDAGRDHQPDGRRRAEVRRDLVTAQPRLVGAAADGGGAVLPVAHARTVGACRRRRHGAAHTRQRLHCQEESIIPGTYPLCMLEYIYQVRILFK